MNAAASISSSHSHSHSSASTHARFKPSAFPSTAALRLEQTPMHELKKVFLRGVTPDMDALVGWEFRGINHLPLNVIPVAQIAGIKKFVKGFYKSEDGKVLGYNSPVKSNVLDGRWNVADKRFGFYEVIEVDATSRDNAFLHSVLLDYSKGDNSALNPMILLRDYLVQVDANNPDLYLGYAYGAVGPLRIPLNFFILERFRVGLTDYARR
jgi:hypothetical protein